MRGDNIRHLLTRIAISFVFFTFGVWEILEPHYWSTLIPLHFSAYGGPTTLALLHGVLLLVVGAMILAGFYLRIAAILATLIMISITLDISLVGLSSVLLRCIGLTIFTLSMVFDETRYYCLNKK